MINYKMTNASTGFMVVIYTLLVVLALCFLFPFIMIVSTSLMSQAAVLKYGTFQLIPKTLDLTAYKIVLSKGSLIYSGYMITIIRVVVGTSLNLLFTAALAYGLSKRYLPGRNGFITFIFITMIFSGGLIPTYMVVKSLHLVNTIWALMIPNLINAYNFIIMKAFFDQIPESLEESASIDGANPLQILFRIVIPLSLPSIATIGLFYGVTHWNAWFDAAIFINDYDKMPLQIILRDVIIHLTGDKVGLSMTVVNPNIKRPPTIAFSSAVIVISTLPILFVYPFIQKYFVKGAMIGSIKG
ncbi:carbohydrate ABC transporter permease [Paenibacillus eucommiae]|uniref:Aldouronate transport system permease protein n=1 Tax=Paenibacillus eucommiae TaxID=1355755 RepID=A0ABS4J7I5_9BACL|nr:carbohydrate ABC transporter permease [Paenibacillus eucommiae]MBP1994739.1 putative aldouronate transport system permease protein [Paenibacillus eucommiae]